MDYVQCACGHYLHECFFYAYNDHNKRILAQDSKCCLFILIATGESHDKEIESVFAFIPRGDKMISLQEIGWPSIDQNRRKSSKKR